MLEGDSWGDIGQDIDGENLMVNESKFALALQSKPASFFQRSVKNLLILDTVTGIFLLDILSVCTEVEHLGAYFSFSTNPDLWKLIIAMPLRSFGCRELFHAQLDTPCDPDQDQLIPNESMKYFPSLTHFVIRSQLMKFKVVMDNFPLLKTLTVLLDKYYDWGDLECKVDHSFR
ncbi:hypothetical protein BDQ17DRAFT_1424875 [Cyathus striatus]|nr:hypothetical protein BDQ17DRAFT_1424875 [Cyathus striatus]